MKKSLKLVNVAPQVWQRIVDKLPKMEYVVPHTKNALSLSFQMGLHKEQMLTTYLIMRIGNNISPCSLVCEEYIKMPFGWYDIIGKEELAKKDGYQDIYEEKLCAYMLSKADEILGYFQHRCSKVPWEMAEKVCHSFGKIRLRFKYEIIYDIRTNECKLVGLPKENGTISVMGSGLESMFYFRGDIITQPEGSKISDSFVYIISRILWYAGSRLNPVTIGHLEPLTPTQIQDLNGLLRSYIFTMQHVYVYEQYEEHENAFNEEKSAQIFAKVNNSVVKQIQQRHQHFWKNTHAEELKKAEKIFTQIMDIVNTSWWLKRVA